MRRFRLFRRVGPRKFRRVGPRDGTGTRSGTSDCPKTKKGRPKIYKKTRENILLAVPKGIKRDYSKLAERNKTSITVEMNKVLKAALKK